MAHNTCNVCNKSFNSEQELQEHQRTAHGSGHGTGTGTGTGKKEGDRPGDQPRREDKIAS